MAILAGVGAKEICASTLGVLYAGDDSFANDTEFDAENATKYEKLRAVMTADGITPAVALGFMVFIMLYFPCIAGISAIKGESGKWRWALFAAGYTTIIAWLLSAAVVAIGRVLI